MTDTIVRGDINMLVETIGKPKNLSVCVVRKAVDFYGEYLLGPKLSKNVAVKVEFKSFEKGSNEYAYCDWVFENHCSRDFIITLDKRLSRKETLLAIAHEMVHVKQYAKGELKDYFRPSRMIGWKGEKFSAEEIDYWEQPWEIEAYGREKGLYIKFISSLKEGELCL